MVQYANAADVEARLPSVADNLAAVNDVLTAMSGWIDKYCHRRFWLDPTVTFRQFATRDMYVLELAPYEVGLAAGVVVTTDDGTGTYATTVNAADYQLEPVNAVADGVPYTRLRKLSGSWPYATTWGARQERVKVTARYGWPTVPDVVKEACVMLTVDHFGNPTDIRSESIDGYNVTYGAATSARKMLGTFRRPAVA
jgi:hypothetical protein